MSKNQGFSRIDYLSLNLKEIKKQPANRVHLAVSEDDVEQRLEKSAWVVSNSSQIAVSRNKIAKPLLKHQRYDFLLDDPAMNQTRFCVEYHRLQDPGLKHYFNSPAVRKRLGQLSMLSEENDAICSIKEFVEYLKYLDRLQSLDTASFVKHTVICILDIEYILFEILVTLNLNLERGGARK